jgi:hypothetical protein
MGVLAGRDVSIRQQTVYQQIIASFGRGANAEERLARTAHELAGAVRAQETAALARLVADTGDAQPAEVRFAQPAMLYWRTDGGRRRGNLSQIQGYYQELGRGRLVVVGPAGSGKTVLATQLVRDLAIALIAAEPGDSGSAPGRRVDGGRRRVPVRLSAPAFDPAAGSEFAETAAGKVAERLDTWVAEQLSTVYGINPRQARELVDDGWVLPVLDGVDEMDPPDELPQRAAALLAALNQPTGAGLRPVVLTCRTDRHTQLSTGHSTAGDRQVLQDATVIEVEPLTAAAARQYLIYRFPDPAGSEQGEPRWRPVLDRLATDRAHDPLVAALRSPLRLFLAVAGYRSPTTAPAELTDYLDVASFDDHLFGLLVPAATAQHARPGGGRHSAEQVTRWLSTLARHLREKELAGRSGTDILLHELWSASGPRIPRYVHAVIITAPCAAALLTPWVNYLYQVGLLPGGGAGPGMFSQHATLAGLLGLAIFGLVAMTAWRSSRPKVALQRFDPRVVRTPQGRRQLAERLTRGIVHGLSPGLMFWAAGIGTSDRNVLWLVFGLVFWLGPGLGTRPQAIDLPRQLVSQGIKHTAGTLAIGLVAGLLVGVVYGLASGTAIGLVFGLVLGLAAGLCLVATSPWPRYLVACRLLARRQELPKRPTVLLDWAYEAGLMRLAGIAVQFRHREFQDWLARRGTAVDDC